MTRIDFYVLSDDSETQRVALACRLAEKAYRQSQQVFIHTDDRRLAQSIDSALWQFREDAFVPHQQLAEELPADLAEPVEIGCDCPPERKHDVLINLSADVPPFFSRFERTLEIVNQQQQVRHSGRNRYNFYRQRGYPLNHHKL